jgi:methylase of polypeptide subunit release factors
MNDDRTNYIPALRYEWLTGLYDTVMDKLMHETEFKQALVRQARLAKNHRVLDLGCGTATLTLIIKQSFPNTEVTGLDGEGPWNREREDFQIWSKHYSRRRYGI